MADTLERSRALAFLYEHLPESDLDCYPEALFLQFVEHALFLRETDPWCAELEQEIFDHYVLFPRVNDEDLSFHRRLFFDALWPRLRRLSTMAERVLEVNRWCHEMASYQAQDERTASPLTVFRNGSGRCGEESAFLVSALRSVGIPARQVYAPRWAHCDDNHAWVEALYGSQWHFLGACEPEPVMDKGWFNTAASRAVLVHSRLFGQGISPLHGEFLGREGAVCWYNQTQRYARVRPRTFQALYNGIPAAGTVFQIQLLNEASFHTIATLTADEQGQAEAHLGLGDVHVLAIWNNLRAEGDCTGAGITLSLSSPRDADTGWREFDVRAPKAEPVNSVILSAGQKKYRAAVLQEGSTLRQQRMAAFSRPAGAPSWEPLLKMARGNRRVIAEFLEQDGDPRREQLVRSLSEKDLRDVTRETLEDHLQNTPAPGNLPTELYVAYVLCPRIELEPLTPWRGMLRKVLTGAETPEQLWQALKNRMDTHVTRTYANLVWTPAASWHSGRCDRRSLKILYVACLRALDIPARLRELDGEPEYWQDGSFHPCRPEKTGLLRLSFGGDTPFVYRRNWTLSRRTEQGWQLLSLPDDAQTAALPAGRYRLLTAARLPNGNQFAAMREFSLLPGTEQAAALYLRPYSLADMLLCQALPPMPAVTPAGRHVPDLCRLNGQPSLLFWLETGSEPTEHVLNELSAGQAVLEALPVNIVFLLPDRDVLCYPTLAGLLARWPGIQILLDDWSYDLESVARQLTCDPDTPPLAVVCDGKGRSVYGTSGYRVGSVALLARIAAYICENHKKSEEMDYA